MAFNAANLTRVSPINTLTGPAVYQYSTTADNIATVGGATYFTPFANSTLQTFLPFTFNVNDVINCTCSDGSIDLEVTSVTPIATAQQTVTIVVGPNSVNTAAIQNLAVTAGKIAANTITAAQIAAGTITATQIAAATITTTQISAAAAITGAQLAAAAGIVGTQLANNTLTDTQITAQGITAASLALSVPQVIRVPITTANFKTAFTAGLACIAAAGANTIIIIDSVTYTINFLTAQYTAGGVVGLQYSTAAPVNAGGVAASATIAAATVTGVAANSAVTTTGALAINTLAAVSNMGVWLTVATQNFATGAGTVVANIHYHVITV